MEKKKILRVLGIVSKVAGVAAFGYGLYRVVKAEEEISKRQKDALEVIQRNNQFAEMKAEEWAQDHGSMEGFDKYYEREYVNKAYVD